MKLIETQTPPPRIGPLSGVQQRPFWSVMIPVYNRATYLEKTLVSVLSQAPGPEEMQIEVIDDASTVDDPEPIVRRVGGDRVRFVRQPRNLGLFGSWNCCIERSAGEWVHILHSDDVVFPRFYERLRAAVEKTSDIGAAFCRPAVIDENDLRLETYDLERATPGILPGFISSIGVSCRFPPVAIVVRRSVYEKLGGYRMEMLCAGDWEMWIRIAAHYPIWYEPEVLAAWRSHATTTSMRITRSGEDIVDSRRCIEISQSLLPPDSREEISRRAREELGICAMWNASSALGRAEFRVAFRQAREGLKCSFSPRVIKGLLMMPFRMTRAGMR